MAYLCEVDTNNVVLTLEYTEINQGDTPPGYLWLSDQQVPDNIDGPLKLSGDVLVVASEEEMPEIPLEDLIEIEAAEVREERNKRIEEADILVFKAEDRGVDATIYRAYREALRGITEQDGFPFDVSWPSTPPEPLGNTA